MKKVVIIGAGPAGLAAAYEFYVQKKLKDHKILIFETDPQVGGISKTLLYKGFRFDLGGHRFYTKFPEILAFYRDFLGDDMLKRKRLSRIYYEKKFFDYPLSAGNALMNLGFLRSTEIALSWLKRQFARHKKEKTFDKWVSNRFGDRLFQIFFKSYTEKVWGIPTNRLSADWAAQRIQNFDLPKAVINAIFKVNPGSKTIINSFYYPKYGPGMLYEKIKVLLEKQGVEFHLGHEVVGVKKSKNVISSVIVKKKKSGKLFQVKDIDHVISTMPLNKIISYLTPSPLLEKEVKKLKFRSFLMVGLIVKSNPFPDQWIYVHDPTVDVGRIQNFKNWSPYMVEGKKRCTSVGMEYFCNKGDALWELSDRALVQKAQRELIQIGLAEKKDIMDGFVYRVEDAYPVYNFGYRKPLEKSKEFISQIKNLGVCGRGGMYRYNNQDHSILTGFYAARNYLSGEAKWDVWSINEDGAYLEEK